MTEAFYALPYPPSVNHYWRKFRNRMVISDAGKGYRHNVWGLVKESGAEKLAGPLEVAITLTMPDKRKRDIDNISKALLDALQHAGAYDDDNQIDKLTIERGDVEPPGAALVFIRKRGFDIPRQDLVRG